MARANLRSLLDTVDNESAATEEPQTTTSPRPAPNHTSQSPDGRVNDGGEAQEAGGPARKRSNRRQPKLPRYLTLERKEARISATQADELARLARKLNRARTPGEGERITDNTLIRIGIDVLLERSTELQGTTEAELRKSVSLSPNR